MEPPPMHKKLEALPLFTPSASPPPLRVNASSSANPRRSSPPLKRQRMQSSTPLRQTYDAPSSSRTQTPAIDIEKEREASRLRLLDVWSSLAERYTRHLDEDDIVDLRTGKITRDNGVIRGSRTVAFGALAAPAAAGYQTADEGSDEDEDEHEDKDAEDEDDDEYGLDELDAFANPEDYEIEAPVDDTEPDIMVVPPPMLPFGPTDEADLQEFMDAERMRRNTCGTDVEDIYDEEEDEETDFDDPYNLATSEEEHFSGPPSDFQEGEFDEDEVEEDDNEDGAGDDDRFTSAPADDYYGDDVPYSDSDEDELGKWTSGEANTTRTVPTAKPAPEDSDSEIEIIEFPGPVKQPVKDLSVRKLSSSPSKFDQKKNQQLFTPPLSSSSYAFSETPERVLPSKSTSPSKQISSLRKSPLHSSSSLVEAQKKPNKADKAAVVANSFPRREPSKSQHGSLSSAKSAHQPAAVRPSEVPSLAASSNRAKPFVLLTSRDSTSPTKPASVPAIRPEDEDVPVKRLTSSSPTKTSKGKGKEKAKAVDNIPAKPLRPVRAESGTSSPTKRKSRHQSPEEDIVHEEEDEVHSMPPSTFSRKPSRSFEDDSREDRYHTLPSLSLPQPRASSSRDMLQESSSPQAYNSDSSPPSRKRKRVVSDAKAHKSAYMTPVEIYETHTDERYGRDNFSHNNYENERDYYSSPTKRASSRGRHITPDTESELSQISSPSASESTTKHQRHRSRSRPKSQIPQHHHPASYQDMHFPVSHPPPPHPHAHPHHPSHPHEYPPIPDPRAQLIIAQAMHHLAALVGGPWMQPYSDSYLPQTPSHRHQSRQGSRAPPPPPPSGSYVTPSHRRHPEPYYDPNFSYATLPPDSPEVDSSPDKSSPSRRKSIVGRSRSRGRRVSFRFEEEGYDEGALSASTPSRPAPRQSGKRMEYASDEERGPVRYSGKEKGKAKEKGKMRADTPAHGHGHASDRGLESDCGSEDGRTSDPHVRGRTPGPDLETSHSVNRKASSSTSRKKPMATRG